MLLRMRFRDSIQKYFYVLQQPHRHVPNPYIHRRQKWPYTYNTYIYQKQAMRCGLSFKKAPKTDTKRQRKREYRVGESMTSPLLRVQTWVSVKKTERSNPNLHYLPLIFSVIAVTHKFQEREAILSLIIFDFFIFEIIYILKIILLLKIMYYFFIIYYTNITKLYKYYKR